MLHSDWLIYYEIMFTEYLDNYYQLHCAFCMPFVCVDFLQN